MAIKKIGSSVIIVPSFKGNTNITLQEALNLVSGSADSSEVIFKINDVLPNSSGVVNLSIKDLEDVNFSSIDNAIVGDFIRFDGSEWISSGVNSINQDSGFNNFSDFRVNLSSEIPLESSSDFDMDCSAASFARKTGGTSTITLSNMSEGQTVYILLESTGSSYTITWAPSILWSGGIPTPTLTASRYDLYEIKKIGGILFGSATLDYQ